MPVRSTDAMAGPRVFEIPEVERLIPAIEQVFSALDPLRNRMRSLKLRINALEMIWGEAVHQSENPDHPELQHHLREMAELQGEFERTTQRIGALGGEIKGIDPALVDFYGVRDGHLVFWCWTRGETRIDHWHHMDEGFARRQPV